MPCWSTAGYGVLSSFCSLPTSSGQQRLRSKGYGTSGVRRGRAAPDPQGVPVHRLARQPAVRQVGGDASQGQTLQSGPEVARRQPNALTPMRRMLPSGQGRDVRAMSSGCRSTGMSGCRAVISGVDGMVRWHRISTASARPAPPEAASRCPMLALTHSDTSKASGEAVLEASLAGSVHLRTGVAQAVHLRGCRLRVSFALAPGAYPPSRR